MDLYDSMLQTATAQRLQRARVRAVPAQHSWAALPGPLVSRLLDRQAVTPLVLRLTPVPPAASHSSRSPFSNGSTSSTPAAAAAAALRPYPRYVAWAGAVSTSPGCIELPAQLCASLQLPTGVEVQLEVLPGLLAAAAAVVLEPVAAADWEVVELNAGLLEEHLLGQAGVVTVGQPLVVWARQAKVTLKVTQIIHDSSAAATAAAAATAGPGRLLVMKDVARLDQGTELHIAPKPRVAAAGAGCGLAPGQLPLGAPAAAAQQQQQQQKEKQKQQPRKPVWLRVSSTSTRHLLAIEALPAANGASSSSKHPDAAGLDSSAGAAAAIGAAGSTPTASAAAAAEAAVQSWLTTGVFISSQTAQDLQLQPGEVARLYSSSSSSSSGVQGVLPLQSLVVSLLLDEGVPWGHVALSPPLQTALGARQHQYVKLRPLQRQQQLAQLPSFLLHLLVPGAGRVGVVGGVQAFAAAAAAGGAAADRVAASTAQAAAAADAAGGADGDMSHSHQQQQGQARDSFTGPGLLLDTVRGLLSRAVPPLQGKKQQQPSPHQQQQQQEQGGKQGAVVAAGSSSSSSSGCGVFSASSLLQPEVASAAVMAWLQLQLASAAQAVAGCTSRVASSSSGRSVCNGSSALVAASKAGWGSSEGVCLPLSGPMLMHFFTSNLQQQQQQQREGLDGSSGEQHLLLLVPVGDALTASAGGGGVAYLPSHLLLPAGSTAISSNPQQQQQQQQQCTVQVAKELVYEPAAAAAQLSPVAQQHNQHVSCITGTQPQPQQHQQHQQQQGLLLDPAEYPWLNPALQSSLQRLKPRLDLLTWRAWQSVELPLPGGVLLVGGSEGGRGWLLQLLGQQAADTQGAHVLKVSCRSLAGQSYEASAAVLGAAAAEALSCCPGLLLLDDLDLLCPAPNTEGPVGLEQATATRLAEWLSTLMHWAARQARPLSFCAAVSAAAALPACLRAAGCLDHEVKVPALGLQGRAALLLAGFRDKGLGFAGGLQGLEALAGKGLEGFDAKDLQLIVDRAVHAALRRGMTAPAAAAAAGDAGGQAGMLATHATADGHDPQQQPQQPQPPQQQLMVTAEDVQQALSGFVAAAFWRAGQHRGQQQSAEGGLQGWQDVGGLQAAVSALKEALVLPAKYAHLLAAAPLRLRTGLLLFGPPGCGKTHVVAAAVAATGARLISVKGPELLNKYIGQSEAAVRELFSRAAAAAPCVLFFDEFDAIAPPRGHDSTGVTDRVVNQLLTELDGVEGLTGVAVLAATSRPDLIDAALLRPGRLDRMVYCGFPDSTERLAILQAVARKLALCADVSLQDVATATEGFTGADLAAILSEAQLLAVHDQIDAQQPPPQQGAADAEGTAGAAASAAECVVNAAHVQRALARARPSLPQAEKRRLEAVYGRFQQSRDPGLSNRPVVPKEDQLRVKHATLA